jgi:O-succinylbenzoic acid--CoA ligase
LRLSYTDPSRKNSIATFLKEWESSDDLISVNTSGSTGPPKTIHIKKEHMLMSAKKTLAYLQIADASTLHLGLSTKTIAGKMMLVRALVNDAHLIVSEVSANTLVKINEPIHFSAMVPLQLENYLQSQIIKPIETIIVGGAPINRQLEQEAAKSISRIYHTFGMTETISHVALRRLSIESTNHYHALPGIHFSCNQSNELIISFPEISEMPIETRDIVELLNPSTFDWIGRSDNCINSGGMKFFPESIEHRVGQVIPHPYFISSIPDKKLGQVIVLLVESNDSLQLFKADFSEILGKFELPKYFQTIKEFIKTANGKINRTLTLEKTSANAWRKIL